MTLVADRFLARLPQQVDPWPIRDHLEALAPPFTVDQWLLPLPVWAVRGFDHGPDEAWRSLRADLTTQTAGVPMCIYVHVPFCTSKCGFCDCYSFAVRSNIPSTIERYVGAVSEELSAWSELGAVARRPVSTVHLGGGTPTFLGPDVLRRLIDHIRSCFSVGPGTELALETTVHDLTPAVIDTMDDLGIRRVHVGVQTLDDDVRRSIGRRTDASTVRRVLEDLLARGWITSVDLICGLPGQDVADFVRDVDTLIDVGVDGFSLYEFLVYPQNLEWARSHGVDVDARDHLPNYLMFLAGSQLLVSAGYQTNTFNHWANARDQNTYFTFPTRGEDLLAVGAIADGVFGDYHYRHPAHARYLRGTRRDRVGLDGGLRRTASETELHPIVSAILSSRLPASIVDEIGRRAPADRLVETWRERRLVEDCADGGLTLTASGSWFAGSMVKGVTNAYPSFTFQR